MDISIIIPVYNATKFIRNCLDSILKQKNHKLEFQIIVVNDGSVDDSLEILNEYATLYSNIIVIDSENRGAGSARNIGISNANGKYFWFIDADDYISINAFQSLQNEIKSHNSDLIIFDYNVVSEENSKVVKSNFPNHEITLSNYFANAQALFLWKHLYKAEKVIKNDLRFIEGIKNIEDFEYNVRFFSLATSIVYIKGTFYNYFENPNSTSRNVSIDNLKKLAVDSQIVHRSLQKMLIERKKFNQIISDLLNKSIVGFFYSLFKNNYTYVDAKLYYNAYYTEWMLPAKIKHKNSKFAVFMFIVNFKYLYLSLCFVKKTMFKL